MDERQRQFRAGYQAKISPRYNGWLHGLWIFGFGAAYMVACLAQVEDVGWAWLSAIGGFLAGNLGEWWLHKNALHKRIEWLRPLWHRHTVEHHSYFTEARMTVDSHREYRIIFFPPYAVLGIALHEALGSPKRLVTIEDVLEQIVSGRVKNHELARLLPWNWKAAQTAAPAA